LSELRISEVVFSSQLLEEGGMIAIVNMGSMLLIEISLSF
jgi:hypothetical protein